MTMDIRICFLNKHDTIHHQFKPHFHDCYEIVCFATGGGTARINGKDYEVPAHSYCVIPPHTEHTEVLKGYGEILFIGFQCGNAGCRPEEGVYQSGDKTVHSYFLAVFHEYRKQELAFQSAADDWLRLFLITLLRSRQTDNRKCKDLQFIKAYIEQYADQKINFREVAQLSGYSYDYFRHIFRQRFGISPQEFMVDVRLSNAKRLLENTTLTCTEIAYRCGFSNSPQMTAMFQTKFGKPPSAIRKDTRE